MNLSLCFPFPGCKVEEKLAFTNKKCISQNVTRDNNLDKNKFNSTQWQVYDTSAFCILYLSCQQWLNTDLKYFKNLSHPTRVAWGEVIFTPKQIQIKDTKLLIEVN